MKLAYGFNREEFNKYSGFIDIIEELVSEIRNAIDEVNEGYEAIDDALNDTEAPRGLTVLAAKRRTSESADKLVARADDLMIMFGLKGN